MTKRTTYIVCLECGKEFPYSWEEMRVLRARQGQSDLAAPRGFGAWLARHHWSLRGISNR